MTHSSVYHVYMTLIIDKHELCSRIYELRTEGVSNVTSKHLHTSMYIHMISDDTNT